MIRHYLLLTVITTITFALPFTVNAQVKTKKTEAQTKPVTTQTAITEDGRKALLNSDGTWKYGSNDVAVPAAPNKENSTLKFETGIVMSSGDVKPVSRSTFYLLDKSFASIMIDEGIGKLFTTDYTSAKSIYGTFLLHLGRSVKNGNHGKSYDAIVSAISALKPHVIQTVTTDFSGKATMGKLPAGSYWLLGFTTIYKDCIIWDIQTNITSGDNSLTLDQNNAARTWDRCM